MKLCNIMFPRLEISKTNEFVNFKCFHGNMTILKWPYFYILSRIFRVSFRKSFQYFAHINIINFDSE